MHHIFPPLSLLSALLALFILHATATPLDQGGSAFNNREYQGTPTTGKRNVDDHGKPICPPGPFPTAPDCVRAFCNGGTISGGDGLCHSLCSCPSSAPSAPPAQVSHMLLPEPPPVPLIPMTLDCRNATNNANPAIANLGGKPIRTQDWCEKPDVNAVCENGKVVVKGLDTDYVCKPLCRCTT